MFISVSFLDTGGWGLLFSPTSIICTWLAPLQGSPAHMGTSHTILSAQCPIPGDLSFFGLHIATLFFPPKHPAEFLQAVKGIDSRTSETRPLKNLFTTRNLKAEGRENVWKKFIFFETILHALLSLVSSHHISLWGPHLPDASWQSYTFSRSPYFSGSHLDDTQGGTPADAQSHTHGAGRGTHVACSVQMLCMWLDPGDQQGTIIL